MKSIWSEERFGGSSTKPPSDHRSAFEHDYDRLLFSTPVRRLSDKTQVFPLDRNDGVRTRLTHSHEVANLAKSIGNRLINDKIIPNSRSEERDIISILQSIGLAHDLGNPPFGHQGESAISNWFKLNKDWIFDKQTNECKDKLVEVVPERLWDEFLAFEGNAQTIRVISKLQVSTGGNGLNLTAGTIGALMKYTVPADGKVNEKHRDFNASKKKYGYFESEIALVNWMRKFTGLEPGQRHPLTWIMEAADDIAYSVLDIEDAMKKCIMSPDDVLAWSHESLSEHYDDLLGVFDEKFSLANQAGQSINDVRDIKASYLRTYFIQRLIDEAVAKYTESKEKIDKYDMRLGLLDENELCEFLKEIAKKCVFNSTEVLRVEAEGANYLSVIMNFLWDAISSRKDFDDIMSRRNSAVAAYGFSIVSDNYVQAAKDCSMLDRDGNALPMRYRELRLLTDMVAGMTDGFARELYIKIQQVQNAG